MSMVGFLASHTDEDQGDNDFFDQLVSEFGNGDLGHLQSGFQQEEKDRLDDAFSKLILSDEECTPAPATTATASTATNALVSFPTADDLDDDKLIKHDSWSKENIMEATAGENKLKIPSDVVFSTDANPPVELSGVHVPLAAATDALHSSIDLFAKPSYYGAESSIAESPKHVSIKTTTVIEAPKSVTAGHGLEDVCTPEGGTVESNTDFPYCILPGETPKLVSTAIGDDYSKQGPPSMPLESGSCFFGDGLSSVANDDLQFQASKVDSIDPSCDCLSLNPDYVDGVGAAGALGVKELQWSSFGNSYTQGSYSDFFSELDGEAMVDSNPEITPQSLYYQVEPLTNLRSTAPNAQENWGADGERSGLQVEPILYGSVAEHGTEFWKHQGVLNHGVTKQDDSGSTNIMANLSETHYDEARPDASMETGSENDTSRTANYEAQPQEGAQQTWENMYPGWYFDYASNEWKQLDAVQKQHFPREEIDPSFSQPFQSSQSIPMVSNIFWESKQGEEGWPTLGADQSFATGTHAAQSNQNFAAGTRAASDEQRFAASSSLPEQGLNWEQQYPGWYLDHQTGQWCQIADNNQLWASSPDPNLESSEGVELAQNLQTSVGGEWVDQQVQPHYLSKANQSIHSLEKSYSLYGGSEGGDTSTLTRGMLYNSWAEPTTGSFESGQQVMDNTQKSGNVSSMTAFQGATYQAVPDPIKQSLQAFTLPDKPSSLFESHKSLTGVVGEQSSAGRPSHALVAFGFGGKLVTMKAPQFGNTEPLILHNLNHLVSSAEHQGDWSYFSALNRQGLSGPLHGATIKDVMKWVDEQIENCGKEDSQDVRVLWGVLKIACQHYGRLRSMGGSVGNKSQTADGPEVALGRLLTAAKSQSDWNQGLATSADMLHSFSRGDQLQAAVNDVRSQLMDGKIKEALQFAQQGQLWGVALVLAWQLGEKVYADTALQMAQQQFFPGSPMRTLLLLFAGQASELFKIQSLPSSVGTYGPFSAAYSNVQDSAGGMLRDWLGNLSIIAANPTTGDEQVITHLGDSLWKDQGEVAGAHTCYLVADAAFESFSKEARLCLVGADHFKFQRTFATPQAIQRTEVYEYAKTLGNPQYVLGPFQPFKLLYAHMLAEAGRITEASRYCQMVIKNLKSAGRGTELEFCKHSAATLEERLRLHSQGGYNLNFSTGKLVGKVIGTIDSTIYKIMGGPSLPQHPSPAFGVSQDWFANEGHTDSSTKAAPMIPSASNNNLLNVNSQVDVPARSVSEPNFMSSEPNLIGSSTQEPSMVTGSETSFAPPSQPKSTGSNGGGYLGRFGSQIFAKARGLMRNKKEAKLGDENKFYYDEKLKRWVEAGVEQSAQEVILAPPPIVASFDSSSGSPSDATSGGDLHGQSAGVSVSADLPPIPPGGNQFSARGRVHGVRSRYVDTFNKGKAQVAPKPSQSLIVPAAAGGWGAASSPSQFFASAPSTAGIYGSSDMLSNGYSNDGSPEFLKPASEHAKDGSMQVENEPLLPKNLNTSFMDVPGIQERSSANNMAMLIDSDHTPVQSDASSSGNMARVVSWSERSPNTLSDGSIGDFLTETSTNSATASVLSSSLILETPPSYAGYQSGQMHAVAAKDMPSGSLQGAAFDGMQEVEL